MPIFKVKTMLLFKEIRGREDFQLAVSLSKGIPKQSSYKNSTATLDIAIGGKLPFACEQAGREEGVRSKEYSTRMAKKNPLELGITPLAVGGCLFGIKERDSLSAFLGICTYSYSMYIVCSKKRRSLNGACPDMDLSIRHY